MGPHHPAASLLQEPLLQMMMVWAGNEGCAEVTPVPKSRNYMVEESLKVAREMILRNAPRVSSSRAHGWRVEAEKSASLLEDVIRIKEIDKDSSDSGTEAGGFRFVADVLRSRSPSRSFANKWA